MLALLASSVTQAQSFNEVSRQDMYRQIEALRQQLAPDQFAAPAITLSPPSVSPLSTQSIQPIQSNAPQPGTERSATELQQELARQQLQLGQTLKQDTEKSRQELMQKLLEQTKQQQQGLTLKQLEQTKQQQQTQKQQESEKTKQIEQVITEKKQELTQQLLEKAKQEQQEPVKEQAEQAKQQQQQESVQKQSEKTKQEQQEQVQEQPEKTNQEQQESAQETSKPGTLAAYLGAGQGDQQAQAQLAGMPGAGAAVTAGSIAVTGIAANIQTLIAAVVASTQANPSSGAGGNTGNLSSPVQDALQQTGQTSAEATAQSQQPQKSQQSQQLSYDYVTAGLVTPIASWPTSLVAIYNGNVSGTLNNGAAVSGAFQATVDFSTIRNMTPSIPGSITFAGGQGSTSFTLSQLGGYIGGSMSGTYGGQAVTGYVMNGVFYGPAAEQMAGQWSMQNAAATLTGNGNFQARR